MSPPARRAPAPPAGRPADHRAVFRAFAEALARRLPARGRSTPHD